MPHSQANIRFCFGFFINGEKEDLFPDFGMKLQIVTTDSHQYDQSAQQMERVVSTVANND